MGSKSVTAVRSKTFLAASLQNVEPSDSAHNRATRPMESNDKASKYSASLTQGEGVLIGDHGSQTNIFQLFTQAPPPLSSQIRTREFETLVKERTKDFVGRGFILSAIGNAIRDKDFPSGYIVMRGEPGIGKTALMAEVVRRENCVHHFNISTQNIRSPQDFLSNTCAQLIVRYGLPYPALPARAITDSGVLSQLLAEAVGKTYPGPIPIVVDALDEATDTSLPSQVNQLYLPPTLPDGVFFIVTSREEHDDHLSVDHERPIYLRESDPQNDGDVKAYISSFVGRHKDRMSARISDRGLSEEDFLMVIASKSEGNFMYLVYVLGDILEGTLTNASIDAIQNLPKGLKSYYARHWRDMRAKDSDRFERFYEPVVCQLAVVREPVSVSQLAEWTKLPANRITDVVNEWRPFLNADIPQDSEPKYRLYHTSFQDFLRTEVGLAQYHERIVDVALDKIPGFRL
jgi:hypothetical protein